MFLGSNFKHKAIILQKTYFRFHYGMKLIGYFLIFLLPSKASVKNIKNIVTKLINLSLRFEYKVFHDGFKNLHNIV